MISTTTWDWALFDILNFDGGAAMDWLMELASGKLTWAPLYLLILYFVWQRGGWRRTLLFVAVVGAAVGLTDLTAGIFKHSGPLKALLPDIAARLRPMHTPELQGVIHCFMGGGQYGTVSAHAATTMAVGCISMCELRRRWMTVILTCYILVVCYSRIYLAYHFPQDILIGLGLGAVAAVVMILIYKSLLRLKWFERADN